MRDLGLGEILVLLERHGFSYASYKQLGRSLGLSYSMLKSIESSNRGDVSSCLRECLVAWLRGVDVAYFPFGGPTYDSLIQALREVGENAVADGIERESKGLVNSFQLDSLCLLPRSLYTILIYCSPGIKWPIYVDHNEYYIISRVARFCSLQYLYFHFCTVYDLFTQVCTTYILALIVSLPDGSYFVTKCE